MDIEKMNQMTTVRVTKEVVRKAKLISSLRANGETISATLGALLDKEMNRFGVPNNNNEIGEE